MGQGRPGMGTGFGFFSEPGSFGAREEVGVYGWIGTAIGEVWRWLGS